MFADPGRLHEGSTSITTSFKHQETTTKSTSTMLRTRASQVEMLAWIAHLRYLNRLCYLRASGANEEKDEGFLFKTHELIINYQAFWTLLRCICEWTMNQNAGKACEISRWICFELRTHHKFHMEPILLYQRFQQTLKPMSWVMHIPHSHSRQHPGLLGDKLLLNFITPVVEYRI